MNQEPKNYQTLTIARVSIDRHGLVMIDFEGGLAFGMSHETLLQRFGIDWHNLNIGQQLVIIGKEGNSHDDLCGIGTIKNMWVCTVE